MEVKNFRYKLSIIVINISFDILQLPVIFENCTPEQQKRIRLMRQPRGAIKTKDEFVPTFDPLKYL